MMLKCFCGHFDGTEQYVDMQRYRVGDLIIFRELPPVSINFDPYDVPRMITYKEHVCRVACFHFGREDIHYFLVKHGMTDKEAILHQFRK